MKAKGFSLSWGWLLAISVWAQTAVGEKPRTWTFREEGKIETSSGTWTYKRGGRIDAELVRLVGTNLVLKMADGKTGLVPLAYVSDADRTYVEQFSAAQTKQGELNPQTDVKSEPNPQKSAEERLIDVFPQLLWKKRDLIENGWGKPGENLHLRICYFSKKNYIFHGIAGEMQVLTDGEKQINASFYIDGDSNDFLKLHQVFEKAIIGNVSDDNGDMHWTVSGETNKYCIHLFKREFGQEVQRSVEAYVVDLNAPCPCCKTRPP